jgi:tRNA pseudouridine13 synthase
VTHRVGEWILRGDYEEAVVTYVGQVFPNEPDPVRSIRSAFFTTRDPEPALRNLPLPLAYERAMLHHLYSHPGDYAGALHELPPKLLSMFVSAFQSYLFNRVLSQRFDDGFTLNDAIAGDRLLFANGRTDTVTQMNIHAVSLHIRRNRCAVALFMPGKVSFDAKSRGERATGSLLAELCITAQDFERASAFVHTKFDGAWRPITLRTEIEASVDKNDVRLRFSLPPGQYATTVCREFMKSDPLYMI